jgi:hypothetical protein
LKEVVTRHIEITIFREESYLQIEKYASEVKDKDKATKLKKIYLDGRKHNPGAQKKWSAILAKVTELIPQIAKAEFDETQAAMKMNRCENLSRPSGAR